MQLESLKLEALKLAYDMAYKLGLFDSARTYKSNFDRLQEDIEDVFKIAEINMGYICNIAQITNIPKEKKYEFVPEKEKNRFTGMSVREATFKYLVEAKKPCRTKEIIEEIYNEGLKANEKHKNVAVNVALSALRKIGEVQNIKKGIWEINPDRVPKNVK